MPIIGIAKRLEEIYFPGDQYPIHLDKKSESLMLIQRIRDEAHRFAITFHRQVRSKKALGTQLTEIEGIGAQTAQKLLKEFKSVRKLQLASEEEVAAVIGAAKAKVLREGLAKNKAPNWFGALFFTIPKGNFQSLRVCILGPWHLKMLVILANLLHTYLFLLGKICQISC